MHIPSPQERSKIQTTCTKGGNFCFAKFERFGFLFSCDYDGGKVSLLIEKKKNGGKVFRNLSRKAWNELRKKKGGVFQ